MRFRGVAWIGLSLLSAGFAHAQELEPRAYSPSPVGTTFVLSGVGQGRNSSRSVAGQLVTFTSPSS
jgi:hypothetical protein